MKAFSDLYWQIDINTFTDFKFSNNVNWLVTAVILTPSGTLEQLAYFHIHFSEKCHFTSNKS